MKSDDTLPGKEKSRTSGTGPLRRVRVLINPNSGAQLQRGTLPRQMQKSWDVPGVDLTYQFSLSIEDGREKARRAIADGVDTILVVGGDGMVNTIGRELIGSPVTLGVIPAGSGNGFARHFDIPLDWRKAAEKLVHAPALAIDVGAANGRPFFVTCSMAWDAALVRSFEKFPVRGIFPYILAGAYGLFEYEPQPFTLWADDSEPVRFEEPLLCTAANLTQFGGGARIAPNACPDDGELELVVMNRGDFPTLMTGLQRLFDGTIDRMPEVFTRRFRRLVVERERPAPIQLDGEVVDAPARVEIKVIPRALRILAP
ncbi:MAG: diacylglycerol kinase family protein [Kiritimatiellia bacterium]|nr:diacylglycerol kinase family protein [Kiritimatiellia bacterium]